MTEKIPDKTITIAILMACNATRRGLAAMFTDLGCNIIIAETACQLGWKIRTTAVTLLVADAGRLEDALSLARLQHIPLALVTTDLTTALPFYDDTQLSGVLPQPILDCSVAELLSAVLAKRLYRPDAGKTTLTPREREVLQLRLKGYSTDVIAQLMGITPESVGRYERRMRDRLRDAAILERTV